MKLILLCCVLLLCSGVLSRTIKRITRKTTKNEQYDLKQTAMKLLKLIQELDEHKGTKAERMKPVQKAHGKVDQKNLKEVGTHLKRTLQELAMLKRSMDVGAKKGGRDRGDAVDTSDFDELALEFLETAMSDIFAEWEESEDSWNKWGSWSSTSHDTSDDDAWFDEWYHYGGDEHENSDENNGHGSAHGNNGHESNQGNNGQGSANGQGGTNGNNGQGSNHGSSGHGSGGGTSGHGSGGGTSGHGSGGAISGQGTGGVSEDDNQCGLRRSKKSSLLGELFHLLRAKKSSKAKVAVSRIVNGQPTRSNEYPWVVFILVSSTNSYGEVDEFQCGGSLIDESWVLTAAHCVHDVRDMSTVLVRIGEHNLESDVEQHEDIPVKKAFIHHRYDNDIVTDDIALLLLTRPASVAVNHIGTVCLSDEPFEVGTDCVVAGWGVKGTSPQAEASDVLLSAEVRIVPSKDCDYGGDLDSSQLCAKGIRQTPSGVADSCEGDSGGPLFCLWEGRYYQAGVVSYGGTKCGDPKKPGVYTDVAVYMQWIENTMQDNQ